jgi:hypothetical protein
VEPDGDLARDLEQREGLAPIALKGMGRAVAGYADRVKELARRGWEHEAVFEALKQRGLVFPAGRVDAAQRRHALGHALAELTQSHDADIGIAREEALGISAKAGEVRIVDCEEGEVIGRDWGHEVRSDCKIE